MGDNYRDELGSAMMRAERAEARAHELENAEERARAAEAEVARLREAAVRDAPTHTGWLSAIALVVMGACAGMGAGIWITIFMLPAKQEADAREAEIARAQAEERERFAARKRALEGARTSQEPAPSTVAPPAPLLPPLPRAEPTR